MKHTHETLLPYPFNIDLKGYGENIHAVNSFPGTVLGVQHILLYFLQCVEGTAHWDLHAIMGPAFFMKRMLPLDYQSLPALSQTQVIMGLFIP